MKNPTQVLSILNKDTINYMGKRIKLKRIGRAEQLVGGKFYIRFGLSMGGHILLDNNLVVGSFYEVPGLFNENEKLKKINSVCHYIFSKEKYIRENYLNDLGVGSVYGTTLYEFNSSMLNALQFISDNEMVDEALMLTEGIEVDVSQYKSNFEYSKYIDRLMDDIMDEDPYYDYV